MKVYTRKSYLKSAFYYPRDFDLLNKANLFTISSPYPLIIYLYFLKLYSLS